MKKNENIFISLQIVKDQQLKGLHLSVQFDKDAPNVSLERENISWVPTNDEIEFIAEAFELIGGYKGFGKTITESQHTELPPEISEPHTRRSSEIRIAPLPEDTVIEVTAESETIHSNKQENDDKIFIQADAKKIDEILKRKKPGMDEEYVIESGEKTIIDRMLKQKKKKE
jgi:hypothetical protein